MGFGAAEAEVVRADLPGEGDLVPPRVDDAEESAVDVANRHVPARQRQSGATGDAAGQALGEGDDAVGHGAKGGPRGGGAALVAGIEFGAKLGDAACAATHGAGEERPQTYGVARSRRAASTTARGIGA
ncbi:hypothetical protein GCM10018954_011930 [Kutzneria kofuensis]